MNICVNVLFIFGNDTAVPYKENPTKIKIFIIF